jgi:anaerobic selenocysteine-containing dehydrogenase
VQHVDKKIDCCPAAFAAAGLFKRCEDIFKALSEEPATTLKLISLRTRYMQNSWLTNTEKFRRGMQGINPLHMHESDAAARGLYDGDWIRVFNEHGNLQTRVHISDELRPGVVAMSHGYGNTATFGLRTASDKPGVNCNVLMPMGTEYEPLSYMSWMSGVPVQVEGAVVAATI